MKKIFIFLLLASFSYFGVAQDKKAGKAKKETKATGKLKADGTPDMRFKENKDKETKPTGPLKKDGTPDKRFKANKKK